MKLVENRTWRTHYRGPVAIHAGLSNKWFGTTPHFTVEQCEQLPRGVIVAVAELVDCIAFAELKRDLYAGPELLEFASGPWCWLLDNVRRPRYSRTRVWPATALELRGTLPGPLGARLPCRVAFQIRNLAPATGCGRGSPGWSLAVSSVALTSITPSTWL